MNSKKAITKNEKTKITDSATEVNDIMNVLSDQDRRRMLDIIRGFALARATSDAQSIQSTATA